MSEPTTTTALVHRDTAGKSKLETIKLDALRDDEALVEIAAVGVCHTDLSCMSGMLPAQMPAVFGHEGGGTVLAVGKSVTKVKKGDKVLLSYAFCGGCDTCKKSRPAYCYQFAPLNFGGTRTDGTTTASLDDGNNCFANFFGQSSFANHAIAHHSSMVKVPDDTDVALYAPLGCGLQTGSGTVLNSLKVEKGSSIVIFGAGGVGLAATMGAKIAGASPIIVVDLHESRLKLAQEVGATHVVNGGASDLVEQIQKLAPPNGVNYAVECTGVPKVASTMIQCLGTLGTAAIVGAPPPGQNFDAEIFTFLLLGKRLIGAIEGDSNTEKFIPYLIDQHKKGNFPFDKFVKFYDAKDFQQAFDDAHDGKTIKAILKW